MLQEDTNMQADARKVKTGGFKFSRPFRRIVHEYKHGIICRCCGNSKTVISFSAKTPKYCSQSCRDLIKRKQTLALYPRKMQTPF